MKENCWFNFALKFAIVFDESDNSVLDVFGVSDEYIIKAEDIVADFNFSNLFNGIPLSLDASGFVFMSNYNHEVSIVEHSAHRDEKFKLALMDNIRNSLTCTGIDVLF